jgi:hypothetical protein
MQLLGDSIHNIKLWLSKLSTRGVAAHAGKELFCTIVFCEEETVDGGGGGGGDDGTVKLGHQVPYVTGGRRGVGRCDALFGE